MKPKVFLVYLMGAFVLYACALFNPTTDVVYVPPGDAVKLRETLEGVKVWVRTTDDITLPGKTTLYEGWY